MGEHLVGLGAGVLRGWVLLGSGGLGALWKEQVEGVLLVGQQAQGLRGQLQACTRYCKVSAKIKKSGSRGAAAGLQQALQSLCGY